MQEGGRKSFRREELNYIYYLPKKNGFLVPYLDGLKTDLEIAGCHNTRNVTVHSVHSNALRDAQKSCKA